MKFISLRAYVILGSPLGLPYGRVVGYPRLVSWEVVPLSAFLIEFDVEMYFGLSNELNLSTSWGQYIDPLYLFVSLLYY